MIHKQLEQIRNNLTMNGNNIITFSHPIVAQSIFRFLSVVYRSKLLEHLSIKNPSSGTHFTSPSQAHKDLRRMIVDIFK